MRVRNIHKESRTISNIERGFVTPEKTPKNCQDLGKRMSTFAGNYKTGCPNCALVTIYIHVNGR